MPSSRKAYFHAYYLANREKKLAASKANRRANVEASRAANRRSRAKHRVVIKVATILRISRDEARRHLGIQP